MAYRVRTDNFEGPFDLLLYLVSRQRIDVSTISIAEVASQYLEETDDASAFDLDTASDFLLVASTLSEIKAQALIPQRIEGADDEFAELTYDEMRAVLFERLCTYKQYRSAAEGLLERAEEWRRYHARPFGPGEEMLEAAPDYLENVTLDELAHLASEAFARRESSLLDAEHIAAKALPVETYVKSIYRRVKEGGRLSFFELIGEQTSKPVMVAMFLAVLELYKRSMVRLVQRKPFGDISIDYDETAHEFLAVDDEMQNANDDETQNAR